jgi:hypothetical protein
MQLSRRRLLQAFSTSPFWSAPALAAERVRLQLSERPVRQLPADYMGLGYETSSVAITHLLSAGNRVYVQLVRNLGRTGVIRIGGNVSDFSVYQANGTPSFQPKATTVTAASLRALRSFLDATGWKLIWGLNLGFDQMDNAVTEARAVVEIMGPRLIALQIGNEPDLFARSGHRPEPYDYGAWLAEYRRYKAAIRAVLPNVPFAGPDAALNVDWVEQYARDEGKDAALLTAHHYISGQANPSVSIDLMLQEERKYQPALARLQAAAEQAHLPYRLCETASFSGGGRADVSDTFAAALWALDYLFVLASYGCAGVNMETGVNHLGWISKYTPIGDDQAGHYSAAPEYYGLLAFAQASGGELIGVSGDTGGINLTSYAVRRAGGETVLTVINKDANRGATAEISAPSRLTRAHAVRLSAASLAAKTGITLAGAAVDAGGHWHGHAPERITIAAGKAMLELPPGSAALLTLHAQ